METLLKHMQKAVMNKGENTALFEDPDFMVGQDKQRIRELNRQVQEEPGMEMP